MRVESDFKKFIELLNEHKVRYLIVGGFAYSYYAEPRFTKDIDFYIDSSSVNADKMLKVLEKFGFKDVGLTRDDFQQADQFVQLGNAPLRIDIVTSIDGVIFKEAWNNRTKGKYGNLFTNFISKSDLIKNKIASGRAQDIADVEKLNKI
jgi:hypothetical protein